jgi:site-specific DNA recombinase
MSYENILSFYQKRGRKENKDMIAVGYTRVSTSRQADHGVSLEVQEEKIRQYCQLNDMALLTTLCDAGISGKKIKNRPAIKEVMNLAKAKKINVVVVHKLDRLARNTRELLNVVDLLRKNGVELHCINEGIRTDNSTGRVFLTVLGALATWEQENISERVTVCMEKTRELGRKTGGHRPYGSGVRVEIEGEKIRKYLTVDEEEQPIITRMKQLKAAGHSTRNIAAILTEEGTLTRKGTPWSHTQICRTLKRV